MNPLASPGYLHCRRIAEQMRVTGPTPEQLVAAEMILAAPSRWDEPPIQQALTFSCPAYLGVAPQGHAETPGGGDGFNGVPEQ